MKVTKFPNAIEEIEYQKDMRKARAEASKCPFCGEEDESHLTKTGLKGIIRDTVVIRKGIIFKRKYVRISCICCSCGAEWDTDKFKTE